MNTDSTIPKPIRWKIYLSVLLILVALGVGAHFLVNYMISTWDKTRVENTISNSMHRPVHLGDVNWHINIHGLAFETNEITIEGKDNAPFFHAGKTTIYYSFFALLKGKLRIKNLNLTQPTIWAERLTQTQWNFSDLPQAPIFSKFADCTLTDGTLNLIDKRPNAHFPETELKHIQFEVHKPFGKYLWPFALSTQFNQPEGLCTVALKGTGNGSLNEWQNCRYSFELNVHNLVPIRLSDFSESVPEIAGVIDLEVKGKGIPFKEFTGTTSIKSERMVINPSSSTPLRICHLHSHTQVSLDKNQLSWKDLDLKIGDSELKSHGKLDKWLSSSPQYQVQIDSHIDEIGNLLKELDSQWLAAKLQSVPKDLTLSGKIDSSGSVTGANSNKPQVISQITLHDAQIKLKNKNLTLRALNGTANFDQSGLAINDLKGVLNKANFEISGKLTAGTPKVLKAKANEILIEDLKTIASNLHIPSALDKLNISGNIKTINIDIVDVNGQPKVTFVACPEGVIVGDQNNRQILKINGGLINYTNSNLSFNKLYGDLGKGNFSLDGSLGVTANSPCNINLSGQKLDLTDVKKLVQALSLPNNVLTNDLVVGKIKELKLHLQGTLNKPQLALYAVPEDVLYEPLSANPLHFVGGIVDYQNGILDCSNINVNGGQTHFIFNTKISHCNSQPKIEALGITNSVLDFKELSSYLLDAKNPAMIREPFEKFLNDYAISDLQGELSGDLGADAINNSFKLKTNCALQSIQFKHAGQIITLVSGTLTSAQNNNLELHDIQGSINKSTFIVNGHFRDFTDLDHLHPGLKIKGRLYCRDIDPWLTASNVVLHSKEPIIFETGIWEKDQVTKIKFSAVLDAPGFIKINDVRYDKPAGPLNLNGLMTMQDQSLKLATTTITIGDLAFQAAGTINGISDESPSIDMKAWIHNPVSLKTIFSTIGTNVINTKEIENNVGQLDGTVHGGMHITGSSKDASVAGGCQISNGSIPKWGISNLSGHFKVTRQGDGQNITVQLETANLGSVAMKNINGSILLNQPEQLIQIQNLNAALAGGTIQTSAKIKFDDQQPFNIDCQLSGVDANELTKEPNSKTSEATGKVDAKLSLAGNGKSPQELLSSLSGSGNFQAINGRIAKLSQLEIKLQEANILESGLLGFRVSNLLSAVNQQDKGEFTSANGQFQISNGIVQLQDFSLNGENLKLEATGTLNLSNQQVVLHATGNIPSVQEEGSIGKATSIFSIAGLADLARIKTPSLPVIGGLSNSPERFFVFDAKGSLLQPNAVEQSIAKSFAWTTGQPKNKTK